jgi:hypothetical protein
MPIVIAYHLIWTIYGYWLPNDPRGASSHVIRRDIFKDLGVLHHGRKRVQPASRDIRAFYARAEPKLRFPILDFSPRDVACVAEAFAQVISTMRYTCYGCAIMPDHVHLIIRKHKHLAESMIANFQRASHLLLRERRPARPRTSDLGRPRLESLPRPPRRDPPDDRLRRAQPAGDRLTRAGFSVRHAVRRLAAAPRSQPQFPVRPADARQLIREAASGIPARSARPSSSPPLAASRTAARRSACARPRRIAHSAPCTISMPCRPQILLDHDR